MKKRLIQIAVVLILALGVKWMWEGSLQRASARLKLGGTGISLELRSRLGQNLAVALLSGFRGIVADFVPAPVP